MERTGKTGVRGSLRIIGKYNAIGMAIDGAIDLTSDFNTYSGSNLKWALTIDGVKTLIGLGMSVTLPSWGYLWSDS